MTTPTDETKTLKEALASQRQRVVDYRSWVGDIKKLCQDERQRAITDYELIEMIMYHFKLKVFWRYEILPRNIPVRNCEYCLEGKYIPGPKLDRCPLCRYKLLTTIRK